jgi:hypothetical protein
MACVGSDCTYRVQETVTAPFGRGLSTSCDEGALLPIRPEEAPISIVGSKTVTVAGVGPVHLITVPG